VISEETWQVVTAPDGRALEVMVAGPPTNLRLILHTGTPGAAVPYGPLIDTAAQHGLQLVTYSRPGYAHSDPRPNRSVVEAATDVATILDALGADTFVTIGWSGGGPHALSCAATLSSRCLAAATIAGVAPYSAEGLDWLAGQGEENVEEFAAALRGEKALNKWLGEAAEDMAHVRADDVAAVLGDLMSDVDKAALTAEYAEWVAASFRKAVSGGVEGWCEDDLAFLRPWGFDLAAISRPVAIWQGGQDHMVPFAHGEWLAAHIPTARPHLLQGDGHLSIGVGRLPEVVAELVQLAGTH
jgi:pimeloyl-ACP methyl ester carboxylesterase